jgi:ribonucleoside-diphosphate reductase alpha chain
VEDYAYALYREPFGADADLPDHFITALELNPREHLAVQAAAQPFVDAAISKTVNCPADMSFDDFKSVYQEAYAAGLKGCTTYRPTPTRGSVLSTDGGGSESTSTKTSPVSDERREQSVGETGSTQHTGSADIVQLSEPLQRDDVLEGRTYKLKWPASDHAIYVTINDIVQDGRRRPFEVFINSKNMEHFPWTVALTRMISAVFRRGGDVSFVVEELQAVFDPRGGAWMHGHYVPSLLAAIGDVVERHLLEIGFLSEPLRPRPPRHSASTPDKADENSHRTMIVPTNASRPGRGCPRCGAPALVRAEGCDVCLTCGQSTCE